MSQQASLLSLILPSYMVVLMRDLGNKFFISSANMHSQQDSDSTLPTVSLVNHTRMDSSTGQLSVFNFEIRGRSPTTNRNFSRDSSTMSSGWATPYYNRMDVNMDCDSMVEDYTPELLYKTEQEKVLCVSKVADQQVPMRLTSGNNEAPLTHVSNEKSIINIQLSYNLNTSMEPNLWSGLFHLISLYSSIEHFVSDAKNIKVILDFIVKYIANKQVNSRANVLNDFNSMGDVI